MQSVERLIKKFLPINYDISLVLHRHERLFNGTVSITGSVKTAESIIKFHSKELKIQSVIMDGRKVNYKIDKKNDYLIIDCGKEIVGKHIFSFVYEGKITDSMHGMYPCYYEHEGIKKELIATQFESHHAREVFPCIDEPEAKATFNLTLSTETAVMVIGNMPIKYQREENGLLVTAFHQTPKMSSYLLAWVIGELHSKSATTKNGTKVSVWATLSQKPESLDFALDIAVKSIEFFNDYFDTPYPLEKCDHVALPDFSSGAMENWGLITYREMALLSDPQNTTISSQKYIATVIAHELSHQWFGNLVTMRWWNDLWLNESFASLIEYTAVNNIRPDWNIWNEFFSFDSVYALRRDSLPGVQPVQIDINHPDEISTLFDGAIVYSKGARLLQMLESYIGEDNFRMGLKHYFKKFAYENTSDSDLWDSLKESSNIAVEKFMSPWLSQPGFPVLFVEKKGNLVKLSQQKINHKISSDESYWPILLNSNCLDSPKILDKKSTEFYTKQNTPIRFNVGSMVHYITKYDENLFEGIIKQVENNELSTIDKLQLLNEQLILANMGIISNASLIKLLQAYKNETEETIWSSICLIISELKKFVFNDSLAEKKLKKFVLNLAKNQFMRLGWNKKDNETENDTELRPIIIGLMSYSEDREIIKEATDRYKSNTIERLDSELRSIIISVIAKYSDDENIFDKLIKLYKTTSSPDIKQDINVGITSVKNPHIIDKLISLLKDIETIRPQDTIRWVAYLLKNKESRQKTWLWLRKNWPWIEEVFGKDKSYDDFPMIAANCLSSEAELNEYKDFFLPYINNPALTRVISVGINELENRVSLIKNDGRNVIKALVDL